MKLGQEVKRIRGWLTKSRIDISCRTMSLSTIKSMSIIHLLLSSANTIFNIEGVCQLFTYSCLQQIQFLSTILKSIPIIHLLLKKNTLHKCCCCITTTHFSLLSQYQHFFFFFFFLKHFLKEFRSKLHDK